MNVRTMVRQRLAEFGAPLVEEKVEMPRPRGREVLLRVLAAGVCHSDLHIHDGFYDLGGGRRMLYRDRGVGPPLTLGHEIVGEVVEFGEGVTEVAAGARCVVFPWVGCGACEVCTESEERHCPQPRFLGIFRDGGYADHVLVPDPRILIDIGELSPQIACTYACSGLTSQSALEKLLPLGGSDFIVVIGIGGLGLTCLQLAGIMTDAPCIAVDIEDLRLETALDLGAVHAIRGDDPNAVGTLHRISGGGAAAVIDFVGSAQSARLGIDALRRGGKYNLVGLFGGSIDLSLPTLAMRELTLMSTYVGTLDSLKTLVKRAHDEPIDRIPIDARPLGEANQALEDLRAGRVIGRCVLIP